MIPPRFDHHPHISDRSAWAVHRVRGHVRAGLLGTTALTPPDCRYKGGGGFMGIFKAAVIGAVIGAATGGAGFALGFSTAASLGAAIASGAAMGAIGGVLSGAAGMLMGAVKAPEQQQYSYEARDNKLTVRNSTAPRKKIYGTALTAGALIYAASTGDSHAYMHLATPLASHQVHAIRETFFNNLTSTDKRFDGFFRINKHLGSQTQTADTDLVAESGAEWTTAHRARGIAYLYPRLKYDSNAWVSGLPSTSAMVDGALLHDPRQTYSILSTSSTSGLFSTAGAHGLAAGDVVFIRDHAGATYATSNGLVAAVAKVFTVNTVPATTSFTLLNDGGEPMPLVSGGVGGRVSKCAWSNNAALAVLDYLLSRDGIGCSTAEIDWECMANAASVCDEDVTLGLEQTFTISPSSNQVTLAGAVGWTTGTQVYLSSSATLPSPLTAATAYFWISSEGTPTVGHLASSYANALAGTWIDIGDAGGGTHSVFVATSVTLSASADTVTLSSSATAIETGDGVSLTGSLAGTVYYWINTGHLQGKLATSRANAISGTSLDLLTDETAQITRKTQARYTTNGVIDLSKKPIDILNDLLTACAGVLVYTQGTYRLFPAAPVSPVKTLTEDDLRGPIRITPHSPHSELVNTVRGTYKEPAKYWELTDFPPITNATYESEDGGQRLYKDIALPNTIDAQRAQRIAAIALGRGRRGMTVSFPATVKMLGISAWDCVSLNLASGGNTILSGKKFRVESWVLAEDGQGIDLVLREEDDSVYAWSAAQAVTVPQNALSSLPSPWIVAAPTSLAAFERLSTTGNGTALASALDIQWTPPADVFVRQVETAYRTLGASEWIPGPSASADIAAVTIPNLSPGSYEVRAQAINGLGARSAAVIVTGVSVQGLAGLPPLAAPGIISIAETLVEINQGQGVGSLATLAIGAPDNPAWEAIGVGLAGYRIESRIAGTATWSSIGTTATSPFSWHGAVGSHEFRVIALTTLGVESPPSGTFAKELKGLTAPPADVAGFAVVSLNGIAFVSWTAAADLDVKIGGGIRVRHTPKTSGATWADGGDIGPRFPGTAVSGFLPLITGTYMAKAVDSTGNLSVNAAPFSITAPVVQSFTGVVTVGEGPAFAGAKVNVIAGGGVLQLTGAMPFDDIPDLDAAGMLDSLGGVMPEGTYDFTDPWTDFGKAVSARLSAALSATVVDTGDILDSRTGLIDDWPSWDGTVADAANAMVQVSTTMDDPAGSPVWSDWTPLYVADFLCRAFRARLVLTSGLPTNTVLVTSLSVSAELPQRTEALGGGIAIAAGGASFTYAQPFFASPTIHVTANDLQTGDYALISGASETGFTLRFFNAAGDGVPRAADITVTGY